MCAAYQYGGPFASQAFADLEEFVETALDSSVEKDGEFESFERDLHRRMMALEAEVVKQWVGRYDVNAEEIDVGGDRFRRKGRFEKEYHALSGTFVVERAIYVPRGGGRAVVPLEIRSGMVEGSWTPLLARVMARTVASTTSREAAELFEEFGGATPSSSSLDRLPKQLSEMWEMQRKEFETELREQETVPESAVSVAVSLDGVQVPMKDGERTEKRSRTDKRPQGPAGFREVGCGTVSFFNVEGERLKTVRHARMPEYKKAELKRQLESELESIFRIRPDLTLVSLADGAEDNWEFLSALPAKLGVEESFEADDIFHVLGHVKKALDAYHGDGSADSKAAFEQMRVWLREAEDGAMRVTRALRYRRDNSTGAKRAAIDKEVKFLEKRKHRLRYKELLDRALPIGSGVVEAACKTLASERMKRSGMRWGEEGGQAVLTLRSLIQSDRWQRGWDMLAAQYRCPVQVVA